MIYQILYLKHNIYKKKKKKKKKKKNLIILNMTEEPGE